MDFSDAIYELDNMIAGMERADSIGADVISASICYREFTNPYVLPLTKSQLDGHTTSVSQAANLAVAKGIFCVVIAGNEGQSTWGFLCTPGDADSVLTIGSVAASKVSAPSSGPGPNSSGRVKPDLCFVGEPAFILAGMKWITLQSGTSVAAPQAAGYAACLLQAFPDASLYQIRQAMIQSADSFTNPSPKRGYGVPDFRKVFSSLSLSSGTLNYKQQLDVRPNPFENFIVLTLPDQSARTECNLFDMLGRNVPVRTHRLGNQLRIEPVNSLPAGIYVLQAGVNGLRSALRVVHQ
jgi:subtilisin family serine protease